MEINKGKYRNKILLILVTYIVLFLLVIIFCTIGSVQFSIKDVFVSIFSNDSSVVKTVVQNIRLPRNLIAVFVGASLSVSGLLLQAVMKNPLADPGITGVSSGASVVAIFILLAAPSLMPFLALFAFIGGAIACFFVYFIAWKKGLTPIRVVLSGVAVNAMLGGVISYLTLVYSDRIQNALLWLNGSLSGKGWNSFYTLFIYCTIGIFLSLFCIRPSNLLGLGDKNAANLGLNVSKSRIYISAVAVFLAAVCTAIVGIISFVGLIVPHISRMLVGSDYKFALPLSIGLGGLVLLSIDTISRTIAGSVELPVGIIMALIGAPFFLYLLRSKEGYR